MQPFEGRDGYMRIGRCVFACSERSGRYDGQHTQCDNHYDSGDGDFAPNWIAKEDAAHAENSSLLCKNCDED